MPILFIIVSSLILSGCGGKDSNKNNAHNWSIKPPILVSKTRGSSLSFKEMALKRPESLSSQDIIYFKGANKNNTQLEASTTCSNQDSTKKHSVLMSLPSQLSLSEIIPPASRIEGSWICSFQFIARHNSGSEHFFELKQYIIQDDQMNSLRLSYDPASKESLSHVYGDLSYKTFLVSHGIGQVEILCGNTVLASGQMQTVQELSSFTTHTKTIDNTRNIYCRAFEINKNNQIIASSAPFWRVPKEPHIEVIEHNIRRRYERIARHTKGKDHLIFQWTLNNLSNQDHYIAIKNSSLELPYNLITHTGFGDYTAEPFMFSHQLGSSAKNISKTDEYSVYEVLAGTSLKVSLVNYSRWDCRIHDHGMYLMPNIDIELAAYVVDQNMNVFKTVDLSYFERKWIGLKNPRITRGVKEFFGPKDSFSALPVKEVKRENKWCKKI